LLNTVGTAAGISAVTATIVMNSMLHITAKRASENKLLSIGA
jgi:hypothetical protein